MTMMMMMMMQRPLVWLACRRVELPVAARGGRGRPWLFVVKKVTVCDVDSRWRGEHKMCHLYVLIPTLNKSFNLARL